MNPPDSEYGRDPGDQESSRNKATGLEADAAQPGGIHEALAASEEKFRRVVESSPMGMLLYHLEDGDRLVFTGANPAADRILGVDCSQFVGMTIEEAFPPLAETELPERYRRVCADGTPFYTEQVDYEHRQIRGAYEVHAFRTAPGTMAVLFLDITERKRVEEALRYRSGIEKLISEISGRFINLRSDAIDEHVERALGDVHRFFGVEAGYLFAYSEDRTTFSMTHLCQDEGLGFRVEELRNLRVDEMSWWTDRISRDQAVPVASVKALPDQAAKGRELLLGCGVRSLVDVPLTYQGKILGMIGLASVTDERRWTEDEVSLLRLIGQVFTGALQRKRQEEALRSSERRYRTLFESAGDAIFLMRGDRFVDCNPQAESLYGRTREEIINGQPEDFSPPTQPDGRSSAEKQRELVVRALEGEVVTFEWTHCHGDGATFEVVVTLNSLEISGEVLLQANVRDITEEKRLEEQLRQIQRMESVGLLAGGVAHDFNNLLSPIMGFAELLQQDLDHDDPRRDQAGQILEAAKRARSVTSQLLAISRRHVFERIVLDLNQVIEGFASMLRSTIREDIDIRSQTAPGLGLVMGDANQIEQVLMNLALNAQDAMPECGTLWIETSNVDVGEHEADLVPDLSSGEHVRLSVIDTGTGMDRETLERAFEPFYTTKEVGKGTGLGLATVYGIVKQHGGAVAASSELGKGSRFDVFLPRVAGEYPEPPDEPEILERAVGHETVVVAEDEELVRSLACTVLRDCGYEVLATGRARDCLALVEKHAGPVHALLTDVVMPEMNGRELYRRLAELRPGLKVVYMSGYTDDVLATRGVSEDRAHLLQKPFSVHALAHAIREALDG